MVGWEPTIAGLIMSMEAQLPTHYNEGTSGSSHSNLDPMMVIMQELQLMRKDMKEMRGYITNVSIEHRDHRNIGGHVMSRTQWGYDCNCEKRRKMRLQPIKTWSLMKQALRINMELKTMKDKDKDK
ncbi:hypothetical protein M9H77_03738 [Catharanthus roseus]|uniref:Uncharacterized protein n=1 Tax=Catharanthus roseus TaxID=4058 RepID=A0ACC0CC92_CATRO|nr:hypothetical protein M9H77_03738 [Catharanthus roseus]